MQISSSLSLLPFFSPLPRTPPPSLPFSSSASSFLSAAAMMAPVTHPSIQGRSFVLGLGRRRSRRSKKELTCNAMFGLVVPELVVIAAVAALVFGPKKLPEVGRSIGKTVKSFQQAAKEFESELKKDPDSTAGSSVDEPEQASKAKEDEKVVSTKESA